MANSTGNSSSNESHGCPICLDVFTSPRQLHCLHSFCEQCLQDYITKKASATIGKFEEFLCPICRAITRPEKKDKPVGEWASEFPQSSISMLVEQKEKVERLCDICSSRKSSNFATNVCIVCEEAMCDDCSFAHQTMKMSRNHKMVSVEELEVNPQYFMRFDKGFGCASHQDKETEFYCKFHEAACCGTCSFLYHKKCKEVLELKTNLTDFLKEMNSQKIMEELIELEGCLTEFTEMNEKNTVILESQVNCLASQICEIRKKINSKLDDLEKTVKAEGNRIYKEEMIRNQEQNHQCQSLINAIRHSRVLLETVSRHGTDTQKFLVTRKTMKQLASYTEQIRETFERVDFIKIILELDSHLKAVLSQDGKGLVQIVCKEESEILSSKHNIRPLRERMLELSRVINVNCPSDAFSRFTGFAQLQGGEIVLADCCHSTCCLYDSSYSLINMYYLPDESLDEIDMSPHDMCLTDDNEVAVTMEFEGRVKFLSIKDHEFHEVGEVRTRYLCYGVAAISNREVVVSGQCGSYSGSTTCYWSIISKDGKEKFHHEFECQNTMEAYIALNTSKSRVYISVSGGHTVYCFGLMDGRQYFLYSANDLIYPHGVSVDREDNVYVVGHKSHNIHKLSPEGVILQVISSGVPRNPIKISFNANRDQFILTNESEWKTLHYFIHK